MKLLQSGVISYLRHIAVLVLIFTLSLTAAGEGTPDLRTSNGDPVLLYVGNPNFGNFASYNGPESSRLNFRIAEAGEVVYFGMSRLYRSAGTPESFGQYNYRIRSAADGSVVFGPIRVNADRENLTTYEQAEIGPATLTAGGYPVDDESTFVAPAAGEYFIEFDQVNLSRPRYIGLWDITVAKQGVAQHGRVYSRNWAFRVPELEPMLPECAFGAELSTEFYSYTSDGFVTKIDFTDSGFQPLSFNLAFNRTGPGESGDLLLDRQSVAEQNLTANVAEHLIFLEEPDPLLFPDGNCGAVFTTGFLNCQENETFCIPVTVTRPGQVQIILDFNGDGEFEQGTDRLLAFSFSTGDDLSACVPWDGLLPDGTRPLEGTTIDIVIEYSQGVQHWALYDGELMRNGFCVTPVRPICASAEPTPLHYDDINIPDDPGNGAPKQVLSGCNCRTEACRTWTNFEAFAADDCMVENANTTGYGDRNTLNTWWFASSRTVVSFDVPLENTAIEGPGIHCPGEGVDVQLTYQSTNEIGGIRWAGPSGPLPALNDQLDVVLTESGTYTAEITDQFGCTSNAEYKLMDVSCSLNVNTPMVVCDDNGTELSNEDDTFTVGLIVDGDNSATYSINGVSYTYGEEIVLGPFDISAGDFELTVVDDTYGCCRETVSVMAPSPCSTGCAITSAIILGTNCIDLGTLTNPDDDEFTFDLIVRGRFVGDGWTTNLGDSGPYDTEITLGPWPIADGPVTLRFSDNDNDECSFSTVVQPPMSCSDECILTPKVTNALCNDNGTPFDRTDDTYTFDLSVDAINARTPAFTLNGMGTYFYDQTVTVGPFSMNSTDVTFTIADMSQNGCEQTFTLEEPPAGCDPACGLEITEARITCVDGGTSNPEDDEYAIEIMVTNRDPQSRGWILPNGVRGDYGTFVRVGDIIPGTGDVSITITEEGNPDCTASVSLAAPALEISCPDDTDDIGRTVRLQQFDGELTANSDFLPAAEEVCWIENETIEGQRRYFERFTLERTAEAFTGLRLFSFYLYAGPDTDLLGAVFNQMGEETLDCCQLTNDGPVTALPTNARSLPVLPDSLIPVDLVLNQRFSVALRQDQVYSLITSSEPGSQTGAYRWLIVSGNGEDLEVRTQTGVEVETEARNTTVIFPLLTTELTNVSGNVDLASQTGIPSVDSLCGQFTFDFEDETTSTCDLAQITRTFSITVGDTVLTDVCTQTISLSALGLNDVTWPESQLRFGCQDTFPRDAAGNPAPVFTGYPFVYVNGVAIPLTPGRFEDLFTSYEDAMVTRPDGGITIQRMWIIQDLCQETLHRYEQYIKLEDNGLPFFSCPENNHFCPIVEEDIMLWPVGQDNCTADIEVPEPVLNNICDLANWTFITEVLRLEANGDSTLFRTLRGEDDRIITNVPPGDYFLRYIGVHGELTIEDRYCRIRVADVSEPVMICKLNTNVSLSGSGDIRVPIRVVDQFTYDNCGIDTLHFRRFLADSSGWGVWNENFLLFDCEDVGFVHEIQLRAVDVYGNSNFCTSYLTVKDNTAPICTGLESVEITCDSLPDNFNVYDTMQLRLRFGMPEVIDNCSASARELPAIVTGSNCTPERIRRRFQAEDVHGNLSTGLFIQDIFITPTLSYAVRFPMDTETDCTDFTDTLLISGAGCDSITVRMLDVLLPTEGTECRYVQRNFVVTNWCEWDGESESIRIGRDENCSGSEGDANVWLVRTEDGIYIDTDSLSNNDEPVANSICSNNPVGYIRSLGDIPGGRYVYSQRFKVFDTTAPEVTLTMLDTICVDTGLCRVPVAVGILIDDACQIDESLIVVGIDYNNNGIVEASSNEVGEISGSFPNYVFKIDLPIGDHRFVFNVTDDCGNTSTTERAFRVNDCYVPVLYCRSDRIYNLEALVEEGDIDNDGVIEEAAALVEAADLARCNFLDCSGDLTFSVNRVGERYDRDQSSIFLDCEDRYEVLLELYVWDEAFNPFIVQPDGSVGGSNWRSCVVLVRVQDPNLACNSCRVEDNITINGNVSTLGGAPLNDVTVSAGTDHTVTNTYGGFQIGGTVGNNYVLTADKEIDPRAGLSTIDLLILKRHLLGIERFSNPFLALAADVNRDGVVNLGDMISLQALILGRREFYPTGSSWRFVDAAWNGEGNPTERIVLGRLEECGFDHDFIGLRIGDLNDSLGADAGAEESGRRSNRPVALELEDQTFKAGQRVDVTLRLENVDDYAGGQLALQWNAGALAYLGKESRELDSESNFRTGRDYVWLSWSEQLREENLLTMSFRATADGNLRDLITLAAERNFTDEIYAADLNDHPLFLTWKTSETTTDQPVSDIVDVLPDAGELSRLLGVLPNPARTVTRLGVYLGSEQDVVLNVTDLNGRKLRSDITRLAAGEQWLSVDVKAWPAGIYLFNIETVNGLVSGRIVKQ